MEPHFRFIVAIVFIFTSASGAPTGEDACISVQSSSFQLNKIARDRSVETRKGIADETSFSSKIPWMETQDKCDPGSLRNDSTPCIRKMSAVLRSYHSAVEQIGKLQVCSKFTKEIKQAMDKFYTDMKNCVHARGIHLPGLSATTEHPSEEEGVWEELALCHYIMERLFSFSILSARVFALGDPARHSHGSAAPCM